MSVLQISGVRKSFGSVAALTHIDLHLNEGEIVSLIGPSGCGKSSLLRIVAGLDTEYEGDVLVGGHPVRSPSSDVGVVFQEPRLFPWLSVRRNIAFGLKDTNDRQIEELAEHVGLAAFINALPKELSGGMAQRCAIARALIRRPRLLLMDEPFSALDAFTRMHLQDLVLEIWQEYQTTMLLVTHDIDEALYLSDRVVVLSDRPGHIKADIEVGLPRPRTRKSDESLALARRVFEELDFAPASPIGASAANQ